MPGDADTDATLSAIESREAGGKIIRGGAMRVGGYVGGTALTALSFALLLRHLGVADFGRFSTVIALVTIAGGVLEGSFQTVGQRMYVHAHPDERREVVGDILGLRLVFAPVFVVVAAMFALIAGYDETMVVGTLVAGAGAVLTLVGVTFAIPLSVQLRNGTVTAIELTRQAAIFVAIVALVTAGATLGGFFVGYLVAGAVVLPVAFVLGGGTRWVRIRFSASRWWRLLREAGPLAIAVVINTLYLKILIVLASLLTNDEQVGLFATASRVTEVLVGVPMFVAGTALPLLAHAGTHDEERLAYAVRRLAETLLLLAAGFVVLLVLSAPVIIDVLAGPGYEGAVDVLRIQAFALLGAFLTQTWLFAIVAVHAERTLIVVNTVGLISVGALGLVLIPPYGAEGAAVAAVVGEVILAGAGLLALVRARPAVRPGWGAVPRVGAALVAGMAAALLPIGAIPQTMIGAVMFTAAAVLLGAVPAELSRAVLRRA